MNEAFKDWFEQARKSWAGLDELEKILEEAFNAGWQAADKRAIAEFMCDRDYEGSQQ